MSYRYFGLQAAPEHVINMRDQLRCRQDLTQVIVYTYFKRAISQSKGVDDDFRVVYAVHLLDAH